MSAPHLHLVTHTEQRRENDALYIGQLESARMALAEENATLRADIELLREGNTHLLEQYAAAMERLTDALEWRWHVGLYALVGGFLAVGLLRWLA